MQKPHRRAAMRLVKSCEKQKKTSTAAPPQQQRAWQQSKIQNVRHGAHISRLNWPVKLLFPPRDRFGVAVGAQFSLRNAYWRR